MTHDSRPWEGLPPELAAVLAPELPALAEEIISELGAAVPEYALPLEGRFGRNVRRGVEDALGTFLRFVADPPSADLAWPPTYRRLGAGEWRAGRSLDALQAAYRLGARVAWRRLADVAAAGGADASTQRLLAESIFAYIDELSAESVAGYAEAQSAAAGEREGRRRRLIMTLLAEPPVDRATLAEVAQEAGWTLPRAIAVLVLDDPSRTGRVAASLGPDVLGLNEDDVGLLVIPDPRAPGRGSQLHRVLDRERAALGPVVVPELAARSRRWGHAALSLATEGSVIAEERLADLALLQAAEPLGVLRERRLEPLASLPQAKRERLEETLLAWLRHRGSAPVVAGELHLHPQTVRYRLAQIRELLGDEALGDPETRFELELALRAAQVGTDNARRAVATRGRNGPLHDT